MSLRVPLPAALALLLALASAAQGEQPSYRVGESESRVVRLGWEFTRLFVANPEVASVQVLNADEILVSGRRVGATELVVWPRDGGSERHFDLQVYPDPARWRQMRHEIGELARRIAPGDDIAVEWRNGKVLLSGTIDNVDRGERLRALLEDLDYPVSTLFRTARPQQVQLFVRVAEVVKGNPLRAGTAFADKRDRFALFPPGTITSDTLLFGQDTPPAQGTLTAAHVDAFQLEINPAGASLFGILSLLEGHRLARVLAQPTLTVESGGSAKYLVGGEVPIPVAQEADTISVEYKEFGVILEFTPTILDDGVIRLAVKPEVSSIDPSAGIEIGAISIPGFRVRRTETVVKVRDGESFIISGLLQDELRAAVDKVPLLGDVPVLGALFRSSAYDQDQSQLSILVTPRIVRPFRPDEPVPLPGDGLSRPSTTDALLLGRLTEQGMPGLDPFTLSNAGLEAP